MSLALATSDREQPALADIPDDGPFSEAPYDCETLAGIICTVQVEA